MNRKGCDLNEVLFRSFYGATEEYRNILFRMVKMWVNNAIRKYSGVKKLVGEIGKGFVKRGHD
jgi:hypothetical protein